MFRATNLLGVKFETGRQRTVTFTVSFNLDATARVDDVGLVDSPGEGADYLSLYTGCYMLGGGSIKAGWSYESPYQWDSPAPLNFPSVLIVPFVMIAPTGANTAVVTRGWAVTMPGAVPVNLVTHTIDIVCANAGETAGMAFYLLDQSKGYVAQWALSGTVTMTVTLQEVRIPTSTLDTSYGGFTTAPGDKSPLSDVNPIGGGLYRDGEMWEEILLPGSMVVTSVQTSAGNLTQSVPAADYTGLYGGWYCPYVESGCAAECDYSLAAGTTYAAAPTTAYTSRLTGSAGESGPGISLVPLSAAAAGTNASASVIAGNIALVATAYVQTISGSGYVGGGGYIGQPSNGAGGMVMTGPPYPPGTPATISSSNGAGATMWFPPSQTTQIVGTAYRVTNPIATALPAELVQEVDETLTEIAGGQSFTQTISAPAPRYTQVNAGAFTGSSGELVGSPETPAWPPPTPTWGVRVQPAYAAAQGITNGRYLWQLLQLPALQPEVSTSLTLASGAAAVTRNRTLQGVWLPYLNSSAGSGAYGYGLVSLGNIPSSDTAADAGATAVAWTPMTGPPSGIVGAIGVVYQQAMALWHRFFRLRWRTVGAKNAPLTVVLNYTLLAGTPAPAVVSGGVNQPTWNLTSGADGTWVESTIDVFNSAWALPSAAAYPGGYPGGNGANVAGVGGGPSFSGFSLLGGAAGVTYEVEWIQGVVLYAADISGTFGLEGEIDGLPCSMFSPLPTSAPIGCPWSFTQLAPVPPDETTQLAEALSSGNPLAGNYLVNAARSPGWLCGQGYDGIRHTDLPVLVYDPATAAPAAPSGAPTALPLREMVEWISVGYPCAGDIAAGGAYGATTILRAGLRMGSQTTATVANLTPAEFAPGTTPDPPEVVAEIVPQADASAGGGVALDPSGYCGLGQPFVPAGTGHDYLHVRLEQTPENNTLAPSGIAAYGVIADGLRYWSLFYAPAPYTAAPRNRCDRNSRVYRRVWCDIPGGVPGNTIRYISAAAVPDATGFWNPVYPIAQGTTSATVGRPGLWQDVTGRLYALWEQLAGGTHTIYESYSDDDGETWETGVAIAAGQMPVYLGMEADASGIRVLARFVPLASDPSGQTGNIVVTPTAASLAADSSNDITVGFAAVAGDTPAPFAVWNTGFDLVKAWDGSNRVVLVCSPASGTQGALAEFACADEVGWTFMPLAAA